MQKDVEAATPMYAPQVSPTIEELPEGRPTVTTTNGATIPQLLIASMPRMLQQMAWSAQVMAMATAFTTPFAAKLISVINPLTSLLLSPVVGVISDHCTHQWGRRRSFLVIGTLASAIVLFLSCFTVDIGQAFDRDSWGRTGVSIFAVIFFLANALAVTAMETPMMLLVADLAGDRQITGAALGQGWSILGSIFVVTYFELIPESSRGAFVAVCILLMLVIAAVVFYNVQEAPCEPSSEARGGVLSTVTSKLASLPNMLIVYSIIAVVMGYGISNYSTNRLNFFETRVVSDSDDDYYYYYSSGSSLNDYKYFMIQQIAAYIFTWVLPLLTNKIGANHVLTISLGPQVLLIIMAFVRSKTLIGLMDFLVTVFSDTVHVLIVPAIVHVYGTKDIGAYVGALTAVSSLGWLISIIIGDSITDTDMAYQLPVLLAGIVAAMCVFISAFLLQLKLKSL